MYIYTHTQEHLYVYIQQLHFTPHMINTEHWINVVVYISFAPTHTNDTGY